MTLQHDATETLASLVGRSLLPPEGDRKCWAWWDGVDPITPFNFESLLVHLRNASLDRFCIEEIRAIAPLMPPEVGAYLQEIVRRHDGYRRPT